MILKTENGIMVDPDLIRIERFNNKYIIVGYKNNHQLLWKTYETEEQAQDALKTISYREVLYDGI